MAELVLLQEGQSQPFSLGDGETVIGRHPECAVQIPSNMVSRKHARVVRDGDGYFVEDLGSGNGTFVNGNRIAERTPLKHEDRIKLGPVLLRFEAPAPVSVDHGRTRLIDVPDDEAEFFGDDEEQVATVTGSVSTSGGFGLLDVRPEAKLKAVIDISRSLAGTVDTAAMLPRILDTLFSVFPYADRGSILLKDPATGRMRPACQKHRRDTEDATVRLSRTILARVLEEKTGILSADAASDSRFQASASISDLTIRSMMCVPMLGLDGEPLGVVNLDTQNALNQFQPDDLELLMAVAGQAALSYESARLLSAYVEKQKQDNELEIARGVQEALLPVSLPQVPGYEFFASYDSAQAVGGDYYDCFMLADGQVCVSFGDVAGKGVPGALVMSRIASAVQSTMAFANDVGRAVEAINDHMCSHSVDGRFVTYLLALIDPRTNAMSLVNAGHMSPIIRGADRSIDEFSDEHTGVPIGVIEGFPFETMKRTIAPGETLVLYTDGVSEAMNPASELYSMERLRDLISRGPESPAELGKAILADVRRHAAGREQNDDITIMTFGRKP
ncbi:MAG: SpoIIE family protein phosphatase [Planctomycetaceae bacterium]